MTLQVHAQALYEGIRTLLGDKHMGFLYLLEDAHREKSGTFCRTKTKWYEKSGKVVTTRLTTVLK